MDSPLAIYIHWPFCVSKCPYCDFNSFAAETIDQGRWRAALMGELGRFADETEGRTVSSVFFGGGTPSLMEPATVAELISLIGRRWGLSDDAEITLEANPTSAEAGRFTSFRNAGINRLSLGVQSLDDRALRMLGRGHTAEEARKGIELGSRHFDRFSFDMIYGRPRQSIDDWRRELGEALAISGSHLSLYQLSVEPGTLFHQRNVAEAEEDTAVAFYDICREMLESDGLHLYEVSNYARPGEQCRHNLSCWRGGDYIGVGPGAHGRLTTTKGTEALEQIHAPELWLKAIEDNRSATSVRNPLSPRQRREELFLTGLRLTEGLDRKRFARLTGMEPEEAVNAKALERLISGGFIEVDAESIRTTDAGRLRLNTVIAQLLAV